MTDRLQRLVAINIMLRRLFIGFAGALILAVFAGYLLPARHVVERKLDISHPPERVWALLADPHAWVRWSPWTTEGPDMKFTFDGAPSGVGARWHWHSADTGDGQLQILSAVEPRSMDFAVSISDRGDRLGQFVLEPSGDGTRLTWRMRADAGWNPIKRWARLALESGEGADLEQGLRSINRVLTRQAGAAG